VQLTSGAGLSGAARARAARPLGPREERGGSGRGHDLGQKRPSRGGERKCFSFFYFLFLISIFYFHFFLYLFLLNNNLLTNLRC
jgi:hypothetical protein